MAQIHVAHGYGLGRAEFHPLLAAGAGDPNLESRNHCVGARCCRGLAAAAGVPRLLPNLNPGRFLAEPGPRLCRAGGHFRLLSHAIGSASANRRKGPVASQTGPQCGDVLEHGKEEQSFGSNVLKGGRTGCAVCGAAPRTCYTHPKRQQAARAPNASRGA
jgi:hypothetical protein